MVKVQLKDFDLEQIADSGQCFRMKKISNNTYYTIVLDKYLEITKEDNDTFIFSCDNEEFRSFWINYFDLETDYSHFRTNIPKDDLFLNNAVSFGCGIRILKQDLWEVLVSFIISQRKSIPAIASCIESLSRSYGKKLIHNQTEYYTFPTPKDIAFLSKEELASHGLGYRTDYVLKLAKDIVMGIFDLEALKKMSAEDAYTTLVSIHGVGTKIANCVLLFGLYHIDAFPEDVWIKRIIAEEYNGVFNKDLYRGYAGIIQQYMFYYIRRKEK